MDHKIKYHKKWTPKPIHIENSIQLFNQTLSSIIQKHKNHNSKPNSNRLNSSSTAQNHQFRLSFIHSETESHTNLVKSWL